MNTVGGDALVAKLSPTTWAGIGILLLAAGLRFYQLDLISVTDATGLQVLNALAALSLEGSDWPLAGPPTDDVRSSAFFVSAVAVASLIFWHPFAGIVLVIALDLCAITILFHLCERRFGTRVAMVTTLLYASSPWGVLYSRLLVPSSCLAVFGTSLISISLQWLEEKKKTQLAVMVALAIAIPQVHYSGICTSFWLLGVLYTGRKHVSYVGLMTGLLLGAAAWVPWIMFQNVSGWSELTAWFGDVFSKPNAHAEAALQAARHLLSLLHSWNFEYWFGVNLSEWPEYFPLWLRAAAGTAAIVLSALWLVSVIRTLRTEDSSLRLLLGWIALSVVFGALLRTGRNPENLLIAGPASFILLGVTISQLQERLTPRLRIVSGVVVGAVVVTHVLFLTGCARFVANGHASPEGHFQQSYQHRLQVVQSILRDSVSGPVRIVGTHSGLNPAYESVLLMEPASRVGIVDSRLEPVCYWIEERAIPDRGEAAEEKNRKERQLNFAVAEQLKTAPNWIIERHWSVRNSQIYRLRLMNIEALK